MRPMKPDYPVDTVDSFRRWRVGGTKHRPNNKWLSLGKSERLHPREAQRGLIAGWPERVAQHHHMSSGTQSKIGPIEILRGDRARQTPTAAKFGIAIRL